MPKSMTFGTQDMKAVTKDELDFLFGGAKNLTICCDLYARRSIVVEERPALSIPMNCLTSLLN